MYGTNTKKSLFLYPVRSPNDLALPAQTIAHTRGGVAAGNDRTCWSDKNTLWNEYLFHSDVKL
jgi:hypothetical protein